MSTKSIIKNKKRKIKKEELYKQSVINDEIEYNSILNEAISFSKSIGLTLEEFENMNIDEIIKIIEKKNKK